MARAKGNEPDEPAATVEEPTPEPTPEPMAAGVTRIKVKLPGDKQAKLFTSCGPAVNGSIIDLPTEEAARFCELELAIPSLAELMVIEPKCYIEKNKYIGPPDAD